MPAWLLAAAVLVTACAVATEEDGVLVATPTVGARIMRPTPAPRIRVTPVPTGIEPSCYQPTPAPSDTDATPEPPSERLRAPGPVPTPRALEPRPVIEDEALEAQLRDILGEQIDSYAVVVKNLANGSAERAEVGSGAAINPEKAFYAASLFKVPVMYEVFHQRSLGLLDLDERLLVTPYYAGFDLGTLPVEVCQTLSIAEALAYMMSVSDNTSAVLLQDRVGAANVNRSMAALGLEATRLLEDDLPVTAADMALLLAAIATGEAVDEDASQRMLNLLASEEIDNGLVAGLPEGTVVAHKTGNWIDSTHDAGIVYPAPTANGATGSPTAGASPATVGDAAYVIVILSATDRDDEDSVSIADISRLVWEYYYGAGDVE